MAAMTDHPQQYRLTRKQWLAVNRALAGGSLQCRGYAMEKAHERRARIQEAQEILSTSYDDARARMGARE